LIELGGKRNPESAHRVPPRLRNAVAKIFIGGYVGKAVAGDLVPCGKPNCSAFAGEHSINCFAGAMIGLYQIFAEASFLAYTTSAYASLLTTQYFLATMRLILLEP